MQLKRIGLWLVIPTIIGAIFGGKALQQPPATSIQSPEKIMGPAVILFRGDNSPGCQAIHKLFDRAAVQHGTQINFVQTDWSADNPLIKSYAIRFLPTVVFIDRHNSELGRIIGESPAVQQKLSDALSQLAEQVEH